MKTRSYWYKTILVIAIGAVMVGAAIRLATQRAGYQRCLAQASVAYENSRGPSAQVESYEFITRGVQPGMTAAEVEKLFTAATEAGRYATLNGRQILTFRWEHGPKYHNAFTGMDDVLIEERFSIEFDASCRAIIMERMLFRRDTNQVRTQRIDLVTQEIRER